MEFHPKEPILASGSNDFTIKMFDYSKASAKKAFKTITDAAPITCMSFHPTGDYLISGTTTPVIRLYDVNTTQCFVSSVAHHQHTAEITTLRWSNDGKHFASGSVDGSIKVWDGVSNRCIGTFIQVLTKFTAEIFHRLYHMHCRLMMELQFARSRSPGMENIFCHRERIL